MDVDLHLHTTAYSPCSSMSPGNLMQAARANGLDAVCITEHNVVFPVDEAKALTDKYGIQVFRGVEITTTGGDILVFGLEQAPTEMLTPAQLKSLVDSIGGVALAAHPFRGFLVFGFGELNMDVEAAMDNPTFSQVHGLEICNSMVTDQENDFARQVADAMGLLKVGGSDAHSENAVGSCVTTFPDPLDDERGLVEAILAGRFTLERRK